MSVNDYAVDIQLSASPNAVDLKTGVTRQLVQSRTVITRRSDGVVVFDVIEPNDTPQRARQTAKNKVESLVQFDAALAAFVNGPQDDLFHASVDDALSPLQVFQKAKAVADRAQSYVTSGVLAADDAAVLAATDALTQAKAAAVDAAKAEISAAAVAAVGAVSALPVSVDPAVKP
jgi:hypothetical protein